MDTNKKGARGKPYLTDGELFDGLMTISSVSKALANDLLKKPNTKKGGDKDGRKKTCSSSTKFKRMD